MLGTGGSSCWKKGACQKVAVPLENKPSSLRRSRKTVSSVMNVVNNPSSHNIALYGRVLKTTEMKAVFHEVHAKD